MTLSLVLKALRIQEETVRARGFFFFLFSYELKLDKDRGHLNSISCGIFQFIIKSLTQPVKEGVASKLIKGDPVLVVNRSKCCLIHNVCYRQSHPFDCVQSNNYDILKDLKSFVYKYMEWLPLHLRRQSNIFNL